MQAAQEGLATTEYALIVGLLALACFAVTKLMGLEISAFFSAVSTTLAAMI